MKISDINYKFDSLATDIWLPVHLQIRERLRSRLKTIFTYADDGNFAEKSSQRNLSDAGNVSSIEHGQERDVSKVRPSVSAC